MPYKLNPSKSKPQRMHERSGIHTTLGQVDDVLANLPINLDKQADGAQTFGKIGNFTNYGI